MKAKQKIYRYLIIIWGVTMLVTGLMLLAASQVAAQDSLPARPSPNQGSETYGPDLADFPPGFNPLLGLPVSDPANLELPAVLISITNYPVSARPQAGPSYAPYIYEMYISEGMTRFLTIFYGDYPEVEVPVTGECEIRTEPFVKTGLIAGNYVWHDGNGDGLQSVDEGPISGVCVNLYDGETEKLLDSTSTDSNGYFGFNVEPDRKYYLKFIPPYNMVFTDHDLGDDEFADSDADKENGLTPVFSITQNDFTWDAGFIHTVEPAGLGAEAGAGQGGQGESSTSAEGETSQQQVTQVENNSSNFEIPGGWIGKYIYEIVIGPIRSGRLAFKWILEWFWNACIIYSSKSAEVDIPGCVNIYGSDENDINSAFLSILRLKEIAKQSQVPGETVDYSGNTYLRFASSNGQYSGPDIPGLQAAGDATEVIMFYNFLNQAKWVFDPLSGGYLRYTDVADGSGIFYPATDRLNGRHLIFHNVVVMFAKHDAITPTIIDINLNYNQGPALLFRDGKAYKIIWNTYADDQAKETGRNRPVKFLDSQGNPVPLHPGQTWVHIVTQITDGYEKSPGFWYIRFYAPPGTK